MCIYIYIYIYRYCAVLRCFLCYESGLFVLFSCFMCFCIRRYWACSLDKHRGSPVVTSALSWILLTGRNQKPNRTEPNIFRKVRNRTESMILRKVGNRTESNRTDSFLLLMGVFTGMLWRSQGLAGGVGGRAGSGIITNNYLILI